LSVAAGRTGRGCFVAVAFPCQEARILERLAAKPSTSWSVAFGACFCALAAYPAARRMLESQRAAQRLDRLEESAAKLAGGEVVPSLPLSPRARRLSALLESWESVGGCGAGASVGTGGALKWIGRNVTGGAFHTELQGDYVNVAYGYNVVASAFVSKDLTPTWTVGVIAPYLYKFIRDPYGLGINLQNQGLGDVNLLGTAHLGRINDWIATVLVGLPTGTHTVMFRNVTLPQDQQMGLGEPTATAIVDHPIDKDWGLILLGGAASWRGGRNELQSYRAPSASLYGYVAYTIGPFMPALGLSATGFTAHDESQAVVQATPLFSAAATASVEWASDSVAVLVGASLPYGYTDSVNGAPPTWAVGAWLVGAGVAVAPF